MATLETMPLPDGVAGLVQRLARLDGVRGVLLGGSRAQGGAEPDSDYDLYVYQDRPIDLAARRALAAELFAECEVNNQFWETEDDGYLRQGRIAVDIVYRDLEFVAGNLYAKLERFEADVGYTTCIWGNFCGSRILFDRDGVIASLQQRYSRRYPPELKRNIIRKNYPLLKEQIPAYYHQIAKALGRGDAVSVNHRTAAFFASYFDILFALNEMAHPGEKRLLRTVREQCAKVPEHCEADVLAVLGHSGRCDPAILPALDGLIGHLDDLLRLEGSGAGAGAD